MSKLKTINKNTPLLLSEIKSKNWPKKPGVYLMFNSSKQVIYIGKAKDLKARIQSYFNNQASTLKTLFLIKNIQSMDFIITHTEAEALLLEASLIKKHKPRYNIRLKDDKGYPYIRFSLKEAFPRLYLERKVKKDGSIYFGPYSGGGFVVRNMIRFLNESFQIRDCSNGFMKTRKVPCLTHEMGYCEAPCVELISSENYKKNVQEAKDFLKGKSSRIIKNLSKNMKSFAEKEQFEQALILRNRISSIEKVLEKQAVIDPQAKKDMDIVSGWGDGKSFMFEIMNLRSGRLIGHFSHFERQALWQNQSKDLEDSISSFLIQYYMENLIPDEILLPEFFLLSSLKKLSTALTHLEDKYLSISCVQKKKEKSWMKMVEKNAENKFKIYLERDQNITEGLFEIQKLFKLPNFPRRIECYDVSHFQSSYPYASQVVFENGIKNTKEYRLYKLKEQNDDYESMNQILSRRFAHKEYEEPQMILVDGGKGQLHVALQVLKTLNLSIPAVAIAKAKSSASLSSLKSKEKFYVEGRKNPIIIAENKKSFQILVQLRNEAHRFAITQNRKKLRTHSLKSILDDVKGIGEKRKYLLLSHFKSIQGIKQAGEKEIAKISGMGINLTRALLKHLKNNK